MRSSIVSTLATIAFACLSASATIINVPDDYPTIQEGINASTDGDTVLVQPGTYVENINFNGHNIVLGSLFLTTGDTSYISQTAIDGDSLESTVVFYSSEDSTAIISGFTIKNGYNGNGGGIHCSNSNPRIIFNNIRDNFVESGIGAGIYCFSSDPIITNNIISDNIAFRNNSFGGGIGCVESSPLISANTIVNNSSRWAGGGIYCVDYSDPVISDNTITDNSSFYGSGGGIYIRNYSNPIINSNTITGNLGGNEDAGGTKGGGICCYNDCDPPITDNYIAGNVANNNGGGIYCYDSNSLIRDNIISLNQSNSHGGGIAMHWSSLTIGNNTINDNIGGGIYCTNSNPVIDNNIIENNVAVRGGGIRSESYSNPTIIDNIIKRNSAAESGGGIHISPVTATIRNNIISDNSADESGGGICLWLADSPVSNNLITGNSAGIDGGGIECRGASAVLVNNTISGNYANSGGGIFCWEGANPSITNNIIWGDSTEEDTEIFLDDSSTVTVLYCDVEGGWEGEGNIDADPLFRDAYNGDFHLMSILCGNQYDSPCIDAGSSTVLDSLLDCSWGLSSIISDIGAYGGGIPGGSIIHIPDDFPTIQAGINASIDYDTILVAPGTYFERIGFSNRKLVIGSMFLITGDTSYISSTVIDGDSTSGYPVVRIYDSESDFTTITGFTIQHGYNVSQWSGGGIYCRDSNPNIAFNYIRWNSSLYNGGGICCGNSNPNINHNLIEGNTCGEYGGGIFARHQSNPIINCNTITQNSADSAGGGVVLIDTSTALITNTISWDNTAQFEPEVYVDDDSWPSITYCDIRGGWEGEGNIDCDPMFCYPDTGNFYLSEGSCCIGAGEDGQDIGAFGVGCEVPTEIVTHDRSIPNQFSLSQNYPNPFNATTVIQYNLPEPSHVVIEIYDILGRRIETLITEKQPAGYHQVAWDGSNHSSGMYFYRIQAGEHTEARKMILLK